MIHHMPQAGLMQPAVAGQRERGIRRHRRHAATLTLPLAGKYMPAEAVQDGFPSVALLVFRVGFFSVESHPHRDSVWPFGELHAADPSSKLVLDESWCLNHGVLTFKVEAEGAVLCFHAG